MEFAALILAGGRSSRMGRDKARLAVAGESLLARQARLARAVGAGPVLISARAEADYATEAPGVEVVVDRVADRGPIEGLRQGLARVSTSHLLLLAVDLAQLDADFLTELVQRTPRPLSAEGVGVAPRVAGRWEPLVALYPRAGLADLDARIAAGEFALQALLDRWLSAGRMQAWELPDTAETRRRFANWNSPADLPG